MAYKNQNFMTNKKIKAEVDKNQKGYVAEEEFESETYYFASYSDQQGSTLWGEGTVKTIGVSGDYTQVEVLTNTPESSFVGQEFYIASNANANGTTLYPLYTDAGTTAAGIYVKISTSEINTFEPVTYYFKSYDDDEGTTLWGTGSCETTGVEDNGYTQIEVKENSPNESFVGQKFYIASNADPDKTTLYPLYTDAGTTAAGIYVKVSETSF